MWPARLVLVVSQPFCTWSQSPSISCDVSHSTRDSPVCVESLDEPPQALLQHSRVISQYPVGLYHTVPALKDTADLTRNDLHGEIDSAEKNHASKEKEQQVVPGAGNVTHGGGAGNFTHGGGAGNVTHGGYSRVHKSFVHGRHDGDDHDDGHKVDAHHPHGSRPSTTSTVIATMLIGMMAMGMSTFYLVTHPHKNIQQVTWTILSTTISIFCAVLIFSALKAIVGMYLLGQEIHSHDLKPDQTTIVCSFIQFIFTFTLGQILMVLHRHMHYRLVGWATIGGHMTAFAAIECFGNLYHYSFSSSWQRGCIFIFLASSAMWVLSALSNYVRNTYFSPRSQHQQEFFIEECNDAGSEYVSLTIGLLISLLLRHLITGHLPPVHGSPRNKTQAEILQLFAWSTGLILALVIFTFAAHGELQKKHQSGSAVHLAQYTLSMSAGWCLLSWGQWLFWSSVGEYMGEADKMQARMMMAIAFSALVFAFIFIFDLVASNFATQFGLRAIISTMALLLGLAWEAVFVLSIESISGHYLEHPAQYIWCELGLTFSVCVVVLPVWWWRVLPKAEEAKEAQEQFNRT